jgi:hypothetical protein
MERYSHTQIGYLLLVAVGASLVLIIGRMLIRGFNWVALVVTIILAGCLCLFATMTVILNSHQLEVRLGLGYVRKAFSLKDIAAVRAVENPWYYGWGIRLIPGGWLFRISGLSAVELRMVNGRRYQIGTDDAERLAHVIEEARRLR